MPLDPSVQELRNKKDAVVRTVENWQMCFDKLIEHGKFYTDAEIANRILGDLIGYNHRSRWRPEDAQQLANALEAYKQWTTKNP